MRRFIAPALVALALVFTAAPAQAQQSGRGELSLHGIFAYYWGDSGVGLGARYQIPIVPEGILHAHVKDDIAVDFGADFIHANFGSYPTYARDIYGNPYFAGWNDLTWNAIIPTAGILWDFWLTPQFALYPKLETGVAIGWWSADWNTAYGWHGPHANAFFLELAGGAKLKLNNGLALKAEVGSGMLKLGVAFSM